MYVYKGKVDTVVDKLIKIRSKERTNNNVCPVQSPMETGRTKKKKKFFFATVATCTAFTKREKSGGGGFHGARNAFQTQKKNFPIGFVEEKF